MKKISIILLMICLSSCVGFPPSIKPQPRCGLYLEKVSDDTYKGKCRCRMYEFTRERIGSYGRSWDIDLNECNKMVGFPTKEWGELYVDFDYLRKWLINQSR